MLLFLIDLINIEIFRISFSLFYSFSFILRSRATSVWYIFDQFNLLRTFTRGPGQQWTSARGVLCWLARLSTAVPDPE